MPRRARSRGVLLCRRKKSPRRSTRCVEIHAFAARLGTGEASSNVNAELFDGPDSREGPRAFVKMQSSHHLNRGHACEATIG
jgi:hypothetical protein